VELVYRHHLSAAAEREDEVKDGACCDVELACGLLVWPIHVGVAQGEGREGEGIKG